jgi:hypothetical protein
VIAACALGTARAQDDSRDPVEHPRTSTHDKEILDSRNREHMHPNDPLRISGLQQGTRDHLANTPALENNDHKTTAVAQDELYRRTLAIYTNHASFNAPLPVDFAATQEVNGTPKRHTPRVATAPDAAPSRVWPWAVGAGIATAIAVWSLSRFRAHPPATSAGHTPLRTS